LKILIADDHAMLRESLSLVLQNHYGDSLHLLHAGNGQTALLTIAEHRDMHLILLDIDLPDINGFEVLKKVVKDTPGIPVISISGTATPACMRQCIEHGASGFIPKTSNSMEMLSAIELVLGGGSYIPKEAMQGLGSGSSKAQNIPCLTERQIEVLGLIKQGMSNEEISSTLDIGLPTVKTHVSEIIRKLDVKNRTEAVNEALLLRLL